MSSLASRARLNAGPEVGLRAGNGRRRSSEKGREAVDRGPVVHEGVDGAIGGRREEMQGEGFGTSG